MAGTISMEDVRDEGTSRSHTDSDRSRPASPAPALAFRAPSTHLTVPMHGMGKKRNVLPELAASTPDLLKAQENENAGLQPRKLMATDKQWLSSQNISSNYQKNISSRPNSPKSNKKEDQVDKLSVMNKEATTEPVDISVSVSASDNDLPEADQDTTKGRKKYLALPFSRMKKKLSSSTSDLSKKLSNSTSNLSKKSESHASQSSFYLEDLGSSNETNNTSSAANIASMAMQHGLDLQMYINEQPATSQSENGVAVHEEYSYGSVIYIAGYQNGQLKVSIKKIQNLPYKGKNPIQYSVLIKLQLMPENKKYPARYCGQSGDKKSPNPIMDEDFQWNSVVIQPDNYLCVSVFEKGRQEKYDAIGHILLPLNLSDLRKFKQVSANLHKTSAPTWNKGSVHLKLSITSNFLEILVYRIKGLEIHDVKLPGAPNIYLRASLYVKGKKERSEKSSITVSQENKDGGDFFFNEELKLAVASNMNMADSLVVLSVVHKSGKLSSDITVGRIIFGPYFFLKGEQTDWGRVILAKQSVTAWYKLQMID